MSTYISAANILATNLSAPNPPKEITSPSGEKYTRTYLSYNYGTNERPYLSEALFELQITRGKIALDKKKNFKLNLTIDNQDDIKGLDQLSLGLALVVEKYKNKFGLRNFNPQSPGDLRGVHFLPATMDGEPIAGASPIVSLKMNEKTMFKMLKPRLDPKGKPIIINGMPELDEEKLDYKTLIDKQITCSVVINTRDLYRSSGTPLPQTFVRSCMILSMSDKGEVEHSKSEMVKQFLQQNPDILNTLAEQIAKLKAGESGPSTLLETIQDNNNNSNSNSNSMNTAQSEQTLSTPSVNNYSTDLSLKQSSIPHSSTSTPNSIPTVSLSALQQLPSSPMTLARSDHSIFSQQLNNNLVSSLESNVLQRDLVPKVSPNPQYPFVGIPTNPNGLGLNLNLNSYLANSQGGLQIKTL